MAKQKTPASVQERVDKKVENIHAGHRARLCEFATKAGVENLTEYQIMELLLTYIFPRGDVNPLAHRLLDEFGSFSAVIEAGPEDLMHVQGINIRSARMIANFDGLFHYYFISRLGKKIILENRAEILDVIEDYLRFRATEYVLLLALSPSNMVTHKKVIRSQTRDDAPLSVADLTRFISYSQPKKLVVAHSHPYGFAGPSPADINFLETLKKICFTCGIELIDSYILGENGIYSSIEDKIVRRLF